MPNLFNDIKNRIARSEPVNTHSPIDAFQHNCDLCKDTHVICKLETTGDEPGDFKQLMQWCPLCGIEYRQRLLWKQSGIHEGDKNQTFDVFEQKTKSQIDALNAVFALVSQNGINFIIIFGPPGTGKTHLGNAAVIHWIEQGKFARVVRCSEWLNELRASIDTNTTDEVKSIIRKVELLVFDELHCRTRYEWDEIVNMLGQRWADRLPTIITTNLDVSEWDPAFDRISSRARDRVRGRMILLGGEDYRAKKDRGGWGGSNF